MLLFSGGGFSTLLDAVLAVESLDSSGSIDQPLLAGVKRMAIRAHFDMHLVNGRTRFKGVAACACHYAAMVFGMDCSFHLSCLYSDPSPYHSKDNHTIRPVNRWRCALLPLILAFVAASTAYAAPTAAPSPTVPAGFASADRTDFAPILELAPPGPRRAERAMTILDRQLVFQHQVLNPEYSPALDNLFDKIPPRNSTLIRAPSIYSRPEIPWIEVGGSHQLCAEGYPSGPRFYVTTLPTCRMSGEPYRLGAYFALKPPPKVEHASASLSSVIGTFGGEIKTDTFGFDAIVDSVGTSISEVYGTLTTPWDTVPGMYNRHDIEARNRFRRDLPTLDDKFHQYFKYFNILDEFDAPGGPYVLFNFAGEVQPDAFKQYPDLFKFYNDVVPALTAEFDILDDNHHFWMRNGFDRGRAWLVFMVRDGKLSAFDADYHPVGEPLALGSLRAGTNHSHTSIRLRRLGMNFGIDNVNFTNRYLRDDATTSFEAQMDGIPRFIAPPGIQQGVEYIAGEFMRTIAQGSGGMHSEAHSKKLGDWMIGFASKISAEFMYSPALEFLARLGDSIADEHTRKVRQQERQVMQEFLDAFMKDYNNARPKILALDKDAALTQ